MKDHQTEKIRRLEELLERVVSQKGVRQAVMGVEKLDGSFRWIGAKTTLPEATAEPNSPFFIASIDKLLNAVIALKLHEAGRLDLDSSITAYLPPEFTQRIHCLNGVDHSARITVRHLLSHTSGLADWIEDYPKGKPSIAERLMSAGDFALSLEQIMDFVRSELKPHFPPQDLTSPKAKARYCDTNFLLLIAILEKITGQPLHKLHEQELFQPLEMRHTYFIGVTQPELPTPKPLTLTAGGKPINLPQFLRSTYGIYSTVDDLLRFLRSLVKGKLFQNPATFDRMEAHWRRFGFPLDRGALRSPSWPIEYGLGIMRFCLPRLLTPMRAMPSLIGHSGSTGCWLFYSPQQDLFLVGSVEEATAGALPYRLIPQLVSLVR